MDARVPVFLCGQYRRGDDAAAFLAAELLPPATRRLARIVVAGQLDVLMFQDVPERQPCLVVDAVAGVPAGTLMAISIARIANAAHDRARHGATPSARSSHQLPLDQTLALAALLRDAPLSGTFLGLGGTSFGLGAAPSPEVAAALPAFAAAMAHEIERLAESETSAC